MAGQRGMCDVRDKFFLFFFRAFFELLSRGKIPLCYLYKAEIHLGDNLTSTCLIDYVPMTKNKLRDKTARE